MVEAGLEPSAETRKLMQMVKNGDNFLLSGGAGSGKTYSLVETIRAVITELPTARIVCVTYTNAAVREIEDRIQHHNLNVSTIHDLLWDNLKSYQPNLKTTLLNLIMDENEESGRFCLPEGIEVAKNLFSELENGIQYKEFVRLKDGIISHDELLVLAYHMFEKYPRLCGILKDKFPYIFVDEYQDTSPYVIKILLEHLNKSPKPCVVGLFGDAMQAIYPDTIGNIDAYKGDALGLVKEVKKEQNRRNPRLVYELANKLRTDGLIQHHSDDLAAPNMQDGVVKEGCIKFLYSKNNGLDKVRDFLGWSGDTKELNLTHNLIAEKAGFRSFMNVYDGNKILAYVKRIKNYIKENGITEDFLEKSFKQVLEFLKRGKSGRELNKLEPTKMMKEYIQENEEEFQMALKSPFSQLISLYVLKEHFLDDKKNDVNDLSKPGSLRDNLIKHLFKIQNTIHFYQEGVIYEFLKATDFKITSTNDKKKLKNVINTLVNVGEKSCGEVIDEADYLGICKIDDKLIRFKEEKKYIYELVSNIPFADFQNVYQYLEGHTPFSTQHKTKGSEYENVLVVLDNGKWNHYNFVALFDHTGKPSVLERTQKIFYVCCTRAKEKLAVFYHTPPDSVIDKAKEWFGCDNIVNLDQV